MKYCPITYEPINESNRYSKKGLHHLSSALSNLNDFPYTAQEQRREAEAHATKLSIQGVQPKLSAGLNIKGSTFEMVDKGGRYILKPQVERFLNLPENEDLTMRLAHVAGIEVPLHGLIYSKDGSMTYFIRRFDREGQKGKLAVEDFAQLSGASRDTKYNSSMEQVAEVIEKYCTFPAVEKFKLLKRTLFSFIIGNEDMHLKNFSLISRDEKIELSPAYDLVNSTLVLASPKEELALPIRGKKRGLTANDFIKYFGRERLQISEGACQAALDDLRQAIPLWKPLIRSSFLPATTQAQYLELTELRCARLGIL